MNALANRFKEPSTWRGLVMIATAAGVSINPELIEYIIGAGTGIAGLIGVMTADY